ncbi:MAG: CoA-binding protein, partial [Marivivens sp.]|nr:CoA-binding protein [Marivivens sp.]
AQVDSPSALLETLKVLHVTGGLSSNKIASMSCSGGEASLMADIGMSCGVDYPPLNTAQTDALRGALGPKVALANPLDYHTYIWGDQAALTRCFTAMMEGDLAMGCVVLDFPREDRFAAPEWKLVLNAVADTATAAGKPMALLASMAEGMPEAIAAEAMERSVVPLCGMADGLAAIAAASQVKVASQVPLLLPNPCDDAVTLTEAEAKSALSQHGLRVPKSVVVGSATDAGGAANDLGFPVVLKGIGFAHKTEAGAVRVGLTSAKAVLAAASAMPCSDFLVEEMITETVAELLVGVLCDPAHGFVLTIGAGGVLTEILSDTVSLLLPVSSAEVENALSRLRCFPLLQGYRGKAGANVDAIVAAVLSVQEFVQANQDTLKEVEINPLLCGQKEAIAVDALIRMGGNQ